MKNVIGVIILLGLSVGFTACVFGQTPQSVGYIELLEAQGSAFELERNGATSRAVLLMPLFPGDILRIRAERCKNDPCTLTLRLEGQDSVKINQTRSPYTVPSAAKASLLPVALMQWSGNFFEKSHAIHRKVANLGNLQGGGDAPLSLPMLAASQARLAAGTRSLAIAWRGGKAPYQVRVFQEGQTTPLIDQPNLQTNRCQQDNVTLTEGTYRVELRDAAHEPVTGRFQVVPAAERPQLPAKYGESFRQSPLDAKTKATLFAAWLREEQKGGWEFEAYQLVAPIAESYYPALLVREQLEQ